MKNLNFYLLIVYVLLSNSIYSQCNFESDNQIMDHFGFHEIDCALDITPGDPDIIVAVPDFGFNLADFDHYDLRGKVVNVVSNCPNTQWHHGLQSLGAVAALTNGRCVSGAGGATRVKAYCGGGNDNNLRQIRDDGIDIATVSAWTFMSRQAVEEITCEGVTLLLAGLDNHHQHLQDVPGVIHVGKAFLNHGGGANGDFWQYNSPNNSQPNQNLDILFATHGLERLTESNGCGVSGFGSSIGTPHVAGVVALMKSMNPCLLPPDIEEILVATADPIPGNAPPGTTRAGCINAEAAVQGALNFQGVDQSWANSETISCGYVSGNLRIETGADILVEGTILTGNRSIIEIMPGARLTVTGKILNGERGKIIVKRGAELIVDGGTLTTSPCVDYWSGVELHGSENIVQETEFVLGSTTSPNGIVRLENGAEISFARIGILNSHWERGGGYIACDNAVFSNNDRSLAFMKYNHEDQSFFHNTSFLNDVRHSVTNWNCHGVEYNNCQFNGFGISGILSDDGNIDVHNNCNFTSEDGDAGIELYHSYGLDFTSRIGSRFRRANSFSGTTYGVLGFNVDNIDRIFIENNAFCVLRPVELEGGSWSQVNHNITNDADQAITYSSTGSDDNLCYENTLNGSNIGIAGYKDNVGVLFYQNCFNDSNQSDVEVWGEANGWAGIEVGRFFPSQGVAVGAAASNDFSFPQSPRSIRFGNNFVDSFEYHIHEDTPFNSRRRTTYQLQFDDSIFGLRSPCGQPVGFDDTAGGSTNEGPPFTSNGSCGGNAPGSGSAPDAVPQDRIAAQSNVLPPVADLLESISEQKDQLEEIIMQLQSESNTSEHKILTVSKLKLEQNLDIHWKHLVFAAARVNRLDEVVEQLTTFKHKTYAFSAYMSSSDYAKAQAYLNTMETETPLEQDFVAIQQINLKWYQDMSYKGTGSELRALETIADKVQVYSGYARTVYLRLTGERLGIDDLRLREYNESEVQENNDLAEPVLSIYPNPVSEIVKVDFTGATDKDYGLKLIAIDGQELIEKRFSGNCFKEIDMGAYHNGIYLIRITDLETSEELIVQKFIKL